MGRTLALAYELMRPRPRLFAGLACMLAAAAVIGCGESGVGASGHTSKPDPPAAATVGAREPAGTAGATGAAGTGGVAREVADPLESSSYPAPASVHHKAAAAPARAGEEVVAAGAPSDAEVRKELDQMHTAERTALQAQTRQLTPVPGGESIGGNGTIPIPPDVPEAVQKVIAGANVIADFPYVYGGGHASFVDNAYDCSGSVSYALAAAGLLSEPETSGTLESWGAPGPGRYITVYANAGHTYMYVDGMLYDTAGRSGVYASRWQVGAVDNSGFVARHWPGL
jgi:cell wall-associated NlpC family hydrolase